MPVSTQTWKIGDCIELMQELDDEYVDVIITSPPYWGLRDYGTDGQIGLEPTLEEYHNRLLEVTAECMRVLKPTGVMFWNHGDSYYAGGGKAVEQSFRRQTAIDTGAYPDHAPAARFRHTMGKCATMQNERLIIQMIDEQGWTLRNRIIWFKPNGMPSSVTDRFSNKYESVYMLTKNSRYWFDLDAVRKPYTKSLNRWGGQKLKANGKSEWDEGAGQESYRDRDMRPNPLGKNPGDVVEMTQVEWMNYCHDIWDTFADERGDIMKIPTHPFKGSHFATFPPSLIEPLIKAACPVEICPVCGMARERITERINQDYDHDRGEYGIHQKSILKPPNGWKPPTSKTIGWTDCGCDAGWIAGTVLDPFCGSGTVLEVCRKLNRNAIGFELNPEYEQLIRKRCMADIPPLTTYFENGGSD